MVKTIESEREFLSYIGPSDIEGASRRLYRENDVGWVTWEMGAKGMIVGIRIGAMAHGTNGPISRPLHFPFTRADFHREWDAILSLTQSKPGE